MVFYSVKAKYIEEKLDEFYQKLIDGTIQNQKPDGPEIVNSMKRAKITAPNTIQWSEMCFCSTPLKHEQVTVYNYYLTNFETTIIDDYVEFDGESFFTFLERDSEKTNSSL
jgi:hypothetical protein